ncbi:flagellar FlbD family protein [Isachenkonia alkalipeptolytica]|uniref:Endoflagellar protein n=1 Tax=Isachenkonia alkalipeptolytica TaxID=2565777 RepID=A0AA43XIW2_9CLOT|nr:flagellar FlbD family protein [Isachenkonia alkalipeptolytica]NBG87572.1 endoflagellar protein [Isachenkonia alkalipeptolytica]
MIEVTKMDRTEIVLNADLIETVERTPDTIIRLTTGKKFLVLESVEEVVQRTIDYKRSIFTRYIKE